MKDKNLVIYIGVGVIAVALVGWLLFSMGDSPADNSTNNQTNNQSGNQNQNQNQNQTDVGAMKFTNDQKLGKILTDGRGMTLYYFSKDVPGKSNCFGQCVTAWPLYSPANFTVPSGLSQADFKTVDRGDGTSQLAYKGWPLYYYFQDKNPGDTLGEDVNKVWFVVKDPFYQVMIVNKTEAGNYLTDNKGMSLYYFTNDTFGSATTSPKSNCSGQCLVNWPPFYASPDDIVIPSTMDDSDFTELTVPDGRKILAYKGRPLYYYINDKNPGETNGQNVGNVWFLMAP